MEWFWKLLDHLQKSAAFAAFQTFKAFDWLVVLAILWGMLQGSRKGFSDMFGKLLGIFLVSMLTLGLYKKGAVLLVSNLSMIPMPVAEAFAFLILAVAFGLSISWCINTSGKIFKIEAQGILKNFGGMLFGAVRALLLISFLAQLALFVFPIKPVQETFKPGNTYTGYAVSRVVPDLYKIVINPFRKATLKNSMESDKVGG